MSELAALSLGLGFLRALAALQVGLPARPAVLPLPARALLAGLLALAAPPLAARPGSLLLAGLAELLVGALLGFAAGAPLRVLLAASRAGAEQALPGAGALPSAAVLVGAAAWVAAGGFEAVLVALQASASWAAPGALPALPSAALVGRFGALLFLVALGGFLPAAAMVLATDLVTRVGGTPLGAHRGPLPWVRPVRVLALAGFLAVLIQPLAGRSGAVLALGLRWAGGGG